MNILVIGTGYVGLVTATCFAQMGHHVVALDIDEVKIETLKQGHLPFYEPSLLEMIQSNKKAGRLSFTSSYESSTCFDFAFIATGTPCTPSGSCDISSVKSALLSITKSHRYYLPIVIKSTVSVGTNDALTVWLKNEDPESHLYPIISNPEFLKEGSAVEDCMKPARIIIGARQAREENVIKQLYSAFTLSSDRFVCMDPCSAELVKYASNAMLATRISFMNEMAELCEKTGSNIHHVRKGMGLDERIGPHFLYAGIGYGGSCFPKDLRSLAHLAQEEQVQMPMLKAVEYVNERSRYLFLNKIASHFHGIKKGITLAIWGLSFKPGTDDTRCAPSKFLIEHLLQMGYRLRLYDPEAMEVMKHSFKESEWLTYCASEYEAAKGCDGICLVTEWKQFRSVNFDKLKASMQGRAFFDGRNQYSPALMKELGFDYYGVGVTYKESASLEKLEKEDEAQALQRS